MRSSKFYLLLLGISLLVLILEVFAFKFTGAFGLLLCLLSVYFIVGTIIRLLRINHIFDEVILKKIDILFFL